MKENLNSIVREIRAYDHICIFTHTSPDGDAIGSGGALYLALKRLGKEVKFYLEGDLPFRYRYLQEMLKISKDPQEVAGARYLSICVDCADDKRLLSLKNVALQGDKVINVDHHITNKEYGHLNYIRPCAATGEIILDLVSLLGVEIDASIATCIYTAISTDTGNFSYSNVNGQTFLAMAKLMETGFPLHKISDHIYRNRTYQATKLIGMGISHLELKAEGRIAVMHISLEDISNAGAQPSDCEDLVNYTREIDGVEVGIFIREMGRSEYKISLRSNEYVDVSSIAGIWGGGGHPRAAGVKLLGTLDQVQHTIVEACAKALQQ